MLASPWVVALSLTALAAPSPAFAATATPMRWAEITPPRLTGSVLFDSKRNRALAFAVGGIWSVSGDGVPVWEAVYHGDIPGTQVYDPVLDRIWAFTLPDRQTYTFTPGRVWSMDLSASTRAWVEHPVVGSGPVNRVGFTHVFDPLRRRVVLFGGGTYSCVACETNSVSILDLTGTPTWRDAPVQGTPPVPRTGARGVYDPWRDRIVFFGGYYYGPAYLDDTWALSMGFPMRWTHLAPRSSRPGARVGPITVLDSVGMRMIVTGGLLPSRVYDETWALDLSTDAPADSATWRLLAAASAAPHPPHHSEAIGWVDASRSRLIRVGGLRDNYGVQSRTANQWSLSLDATPTWTALIREYVRPPVRVGHVAFWNAGTENWCFGLGKDADVWSRSGATADTWQYFLSPGVLRSLFWAGIASDPAGSRALAFGGSAGNYPSELGQERSDLWSFSYNGYSWKPVAVAASPPPRADALVVMDYRRRRLMVHGGSYSDGNRIKLRADTWAYDAGPGTWHLLPAGSFGGRRGEAGIYDPVGDRVIAFGGSDSVTARADVHTLGLTQGGTWTALATTGTPPPLIHPRSLRAAYDAVRDRMIVVASDGAYLGVYALSLDSTPTWSTIPIPGGRPMAREDYALAADADGNRLLVSGGELDNYEMADAWEISLGGARPVASLLTSDVAPDRVRLVWQLGAERVPMMAHRRVPGGAWTPLGQLIPDLEGRLVLDDPGIEETLTYEYRLTHAPGGRELLVGGLTIVVPSTTRTTASLVSSHAAPDRVRLVWQLGPGDGLITAYRREPGGPWVPLREVVPDGEDRVDLEDLDIAPGRTYEYRLGSVNRGGYHFFGEVRIEVPRAPLLALSDISPNPVTGPWSISFSLESREPARLELLDITGRRVLSREIGLGPGSHTLALTREERPATAGLYFVRLIQGNQARLTRVTVLR